MPLTLDENSAAYQIRAYSPGAIQINEQTLTHSLIIAPHKLINDWAPQHINELRHEHWEIVIKELQPGILLIGTGNVLEFPPLEVYGDLLNQGIGVEIMNTRSACHTYNALASERRNVVAALII
jgi:uncharacterized protein